MSICSSCSTLSGTHSTQPDSEMFNGIDGILLGKRQSRVLVQSSAVLFWHAVAILNIKSDHTNFAGVAVEDTCEIVPSKRKRYSHYVPAVKERYHLFHQGFGCFSLRCEPCGAVLHDGSAECMVCEHN